MEVVLPFFFDICPDTAAEGCAPVVWRMARAVGGEFGVAPDVPVRLGVGQWTDAGTVV